MFCLRKKALRFSSRLLTWSQWKRNSKCLYSTQNFSVEKLSNRRVLQVSGESSCDFLQGMITNDMRLLQNGSSSIYAMFLNNKGRILYDVLIYRTERNDTYLLDCDSDCVDQLIKHLKMYKVRRKIDIKSMDSEYCVWAVYNSRLIEYLHNPEQVKIDTDISKYKLEIPTNENLIFVPDPRISALGYRALIKGPNSLEQFSEDNQYTLCRYKLGVGEGSSDFEIGQSFPLEVNCDYLNGVSFDKGCYIGQEVTARTHHTGVVRKRLMPLQFDIEPESSIPYNTSINDPEAQKNPIGKFKGSCGKYGIGLMRVSEAIASKSLNFLYVVARAYVPHWWPLDLVQQKYLKPRMV